MTNKIYWQTRLDGLRHFGYGPETMKRIKVCGNCHEGNDASENFCTRCGHRLPEKTLFFIYQQMHPYCPVCGTVAPDHALYCPSCASKLVNRTAESEAAKSG